MFLLATAVFLPPEMQTLSQDGPPCAVILEMTQLCPAWCCFGHSICSYFLRHLQASEGLILLGPHKAGSILILPTPGGSLVSLQICLLPPTSSSPEAKGQQYPMMPVCNAIFPCKPQVDFDCSESKPCHEMTLSRLVAGSFSCKQAKVVHSTNLVHLLMFCSKLSCSSSLKVRTITRAGSRGLCCCHKP